MILPSNDNYTIETDSEYNQPYLIYGKKKHIYLIVKRVMDVVLSLVGLPFALILIIVFGILIKMESEGPWLYRQERVGRKGKVFNMYKLRSMHMDSEIAGPQWAQVNDIRVTRVGKIIRKFRIDELPQIFNILKGEMSIVGPRPERQFFIEKLSRQYPAYIIRLQVKPGLTGWAQVNGGYDLEVKEKLELDLYYIESQSLWMNLKIIWMTIGVIFNQRGAR